MAELTLQATTRQEDAKAKTLRSQGEIPAILYGHNVKNASLTLPYNVFAKTYREAGENTLIDLSVDGGQPTKVLIHEVDHDVVSNDYRHVDLYVVNMKEKIHTEIPIHFIGEAPAVKSAGGTLVTQMESLPVKCLPQDLIKFVEIDVSNLDSFDVSVKVKDIAVPDTLEVLRDEEDVVALVTAPRIEKEETPVEEESAETDEAKTEAGAEGKAEESNEQPAKEA